MNTYDKIKLIIILGNFINIISVIYYIFGLFTNKIKYLIISLLMIIISNNLLIILLDLYDEYFDTKIKL